MLKRKTLLEQNDMTSEEWTALLEAKDIDKVVQVPNGDEFQQAINAEEKSGFGLGDRRTDKENESYTKVNQFLFLMKLLGFFIALFALLYGAALLAV